MADFIGVQWSTEAQATADWSHASAVLLNVWQSIESTIPWILRSVIEAYVNADPLASATVLMLAFAFWCWFASIISGNCSQVDRLWSIVPFVYTTHFALHDVIVAYASALLSGSDCDVALLAARKAVESSWSNPRLAVMAWLSITWGLRLTFNFARKGGYTAGSEDYRWPVLRERIPSVVFHVFNVVFIALYQNALLMYFSLPAYIAWLNRHTTPWNQWDSIAMALFVVFLLGETIADQQQWNFQSAKHRLLAQKRSLDGTEYALGFLTRGLFRFSRHPNFFCEMSLWWSFYLFSVAASGVWINWTIGGTVLLTLLFQGSTRFTEQLSIDKYPLYVEYQRTTSRLIPWLPGPLVNPKAKRQ